MNGPEQRPEFGPRGYVPPRAARRARKIVLREPMGLGWPVAAVLAGLLVLALGAVFLLTRTGPPGPPYVPVAPLGEMDPRGATAAAARGQEILVVRAGGPVRVFASPAEDIAYCRTSRRLESARGGVWALDGRHLGGPGVSLVPYPSQVHDGVLYVVLSPATEPPAGVDAEVEPAC